MFEPREDDRMRCVAAALREAERNAQEADWLDQPKFADYWHAEAQRLRRLLKEGQTHDPRF